MKLEINAFTTDHAAASDLDALYPHWLARGLGLPPGIMLGGPPKLANPKNWKDANVGWGLVLPFAEHLSPTQLATADDAPEPIRQLLAHRGHGPVLRYASDLPEWGIRRYYPDGHDRTISIVGAPRGTGDDALPRYLLIYRSPTAIPWRFQYRLSAGAFVGRLDLEGEGLANYVRAAITDWDGVGSVAGRAVVWAVDHGGDITTLMRRSVAVPVRNALAKNDSIKASFIDGAAEKATGSRLVQALADTRPGLVVTTSHGMTGPVDDVPRMTTQLGLLVDSDREVVQPAAALASWKPDGAVWYAHACCSAGGDDTTSFAGLVPKDSEVDLVFRGIAACGALVAPLPRALLGASRPLRAFIGHVEPTSDWSLRQPETGLLLTASIVEALYDHLYQPEPIGLAFDACRQQGAQLNTIFLNARQIFNNSPQSSGIEQMLATRLMAVDRESMVILGDPAVAMQSL